jgi:hypothetical protein
VDDRHRQATRIVQKLRSPEWSALFVDDPVRPAARIVRK